MLNPSSSVEKDYGAKHVEGDKKNYYKKALAFNNTVHIYIYINKCLRQPQATIKGEKISFCYGVCLSLKNLCVPL